MDENRSFKQLGVGLGAIDGAKIKVSCRKIPRILDNFSIYVAATLQKVIVNEVLHFYLHFYRKTLCFENVLLAGPCLLYHKVTAKGLFHFCGAGDGKCCG